MNASVAPRLDASTPASSWRRTGRSGRWLQQAGSVWTLLRLPVDVQVPPLRHRREECVELAQYFLQRHQGLRSLRLSVGATDALLAYEWPGNVRELERVMERAVALAGSDMLELDDLPPALLGGYSDVLMPSIHARDTMRAWGSRYARLVLERCANNKRRASRELGISYHTLQEYLRSARRRRDTARTP